MTTLAPLDRTPVRPTVARRVGLAAAGLFACLLPTVWTAGTVAELVTGAERDHLFHQFTGQGLLLGALWLGGLLPLLIAAWRGVRPSPVAAALHLAVVGGARYAFTPETTWSLLAAGLGVLGAAATAARLARKAG